MSSIIPSIPNQIMNGQTADAGQVLANFAAIQAAVNANAAENGANYSITSLNGLTTPLGQVEGGLGANNFAAGLANLLQGATTTTTNVAALVSLFGPATSSDKTTLLTNLFAVSAALLAVLNGGKLPISAGGTGGIDFSAANPGYLVIPGTNVVFQFGLGGSVGPSSGAAISFAKAVTGECVVIPVAYTNSVISGGSISYGNQTGSGFTYFNGSSSTVTAGYIAVGSYDLRYRYNFDFSADRYDYIICCKHGRQYCYYGVQISR